MRVPLVIATILFCGVSTWWLADDGVRLASAASVDSLTGGGTRCYYPNPVQCANALPESNCEDWCYWDDSFYGPYEPGDEDHFDWGWFGAWRCPGPTTDVEIADLSTTIKTQDANANGWNGDQEKDEEKCNDIYNCNCGAEPAPRWGGVEAWCDTVGMPLDSPMGTFREVTGDQDCKPGS